MASEGPERGASRHEGAEVLSSMNPTGRFSDRVGDYVRFRPGYPSATIDSVLSGLGATDALAAADIGAGTGIFARALAERGVQVIAVEPNAEMRAAGARAGTGSAGGRITWRDGKAEATGLASASVNLVTCAQAFHWFHVDEALTELARVLVPGGRLALVWNARDRGDDFTRGYTEAIVAIGGESRVETHAFDPGVVAARREFGSECPRLEVARHEQVLDLEGLVGRALSASYVPRSGPNHERLMDSLRRLFERHEAGGVVRMKYRTEAYLARRV
ncbi:MAG: class I SAM-dependent methyltransferase [Phycisphaerales bacterium]